MLLNKISADEYGVVKDNGNGVVSDVKRRRGLVIIPFIEN